MEKLKKFLIRPTNRITLFIVVFFGLLSARSLIGTGYFLMHDDLQMMRQLQMEKCFSDGQIPCRWTPDMGYGYGYPLFNYYPPLPYFIGEIYRVLGFSFVVSVKLTFALSLILSGVAMFYLAKEFFGKLGGLLASAFYVWAPYHAVDVFVRGAMNESWALVFFPLIFLFSYRILTRSPAENKGSAFSVIVTKDTINLSLAYTALVLSHNIMFLIVTPFFLVWIFIIMLQNKSFNKIVNLGTAGILSFSLPAFFLLPVIFERNLVKIEQLTEDYYNYVAHFASVYQIFISRFWGDGPSIFGTENDGMSFSVGHLHWILSLVALFLFIYIFFKSRKKSEVFLKSNVFLPFVFFIFLGWSSLFMVHFRSDFIWRAFPFLSYAQFPWRFLSLSIFGLSLAVSAIPKLLKILIGEKNLRRVISFPVNSTFTATTIILLIIINWNFFKPVRGGPLKDEEKFAGEAWRIQQIASIRDYLPRTAKEDPKSQRNRDYDVMKGKINLNNFKQGTYWISFNSESQIGSTVKINNLYFPEWRIFIDGTEAKLYIPDEEPWGLMWVDIPAGSHFVYAQLFNTPVRTAGNILSVVTLFYIVFYLVTERGKSRLSRHA